MGPLIGGLLKARALSPTVSIILSPPVVGVALLGGYSNKAITTLCYYLKRSRRRICLEKQIIVSEKKAAEERDSLIIRPGSSISSDDS